MQEIAKRAKLAVALPLAGCLLLSVLLGLQWWDGWQRAQQVDQLMQLALRTSAAISAVQDERAVTVSALGGVENFAGRVSAARRSTDESLDEWRKGLPRGATEAGVDPLDRQLELTRAAVARLPALRTAADEGRATPQATIGAYTTIIDRLAESVDAVALDLAVPELAARMIAFRRLIVFIEYTARERSLGVGLLGANGADATYRQTLLDNMTEQRVMLQQMREAPPGSLDRQLYELIASSDYGEAMAAFRSRLLEIARLAEADPQAAHAWFELSSAYIRDLETARDLWALQLGAAEQALTNRATSRYLALGAGLVLLLAALLWVSLALGRRLAWQAAAEHRDAEHIRYLGRHDPLTGLPNRHYFEELLQAEQRTTLAAGKMLALHILDIVDFKDVNRVWGIATGDAVIREVAKRLCEHHPDGDHCARLYADQFGLLQPGITDKSEAEALAAEVLAAFAEPVRVEDRVISLRVRIGITLYPPNATTYDVLVRNADLARQHVVEGGGYTFYVSEMYQQYLEERSLAKELERALEEGEFRLVYQPKLDLASGRLSGLEALVRWHHPRKGVLGPGHFIEEAERSGLIVGLGAWAFAEACRQLHSWRQAGLRLPVVAINLSAVQLMQADLVPRFRAVIDRCGVDPSHLELEITESAFIGDLEATLVTLGQLRSLGLSLAIDDFGTGYSSLAYLQRLPASKLKLDRSFVSVLETSRSTGQIVAAVITLSHGLGLRVIAEGVESQAQLELLRRKGCDEVQGYLVARPLAPEALVEWLKAG